MICGKRDIGTRDLQELMVWGYYKTVGDYFFKSYYFNFVFQNPLYEQAEDQKGSLSISCKAPTG